MDCKVVKGFFKEEGTQGLRYSRYAGCNSSINTNPLLFPTLKLPEICFFIIVLEVVQDGFYN